jgi:hypothetical protein
VYSVLRSVFVCVVTESKLWHIFTNRNGVYSLQLDSDLIKRDIFKLLKHRQCQELDEIFGRNELI